MARCGGDLLALYQMAYALFLPSFQRQLVSNGLEEIAHYGLSLDMHSRLRGETRSRTALSAISVLEQRMFLGERLLRDTDATSMAASIEVRLPLVDQVLLRTSIACATANGTIRCEKNQFCGGSAYEGLIQPCLNVPRQGLNCRLTGGSERNWARYSIKQCAIRTRSNR